MIKFSRKSEYGLRVMLHVASYGNKTLVAIRDIAMRQTIPVGTLWEVVQKLEQAGLLHVVRGAFSRCTMTRHADQISVLDVIRAIEERTPVGTSGREPAISFQTDQCVADGVLMEMMKRLADYFSSVTLNDLHVRAAR